MLLLLLIQLKININAYNIQDEKIVKQVIYIQALITIILLVKRFSNNSSIIIHASQCREV